MVFGSHQAWRDIDRGVPGCQPAMFAVFLGGLGQSSPAGFSGAEPKTRKAECGAGQLGCGAGSKWPLRARPRPLPQGCLRLAWINRSARFRSQRSDRHRHIVRRCMDPARPVEAVWLAGRARHRDGNVSRHHHPTSSLPHSNPNTAARRQSRRKVIWISLPD